MKYSFFALCALVCSLASPGVALADQRSDAMAMLAKLRQEGIANRLPDEMRSLDSALATAEMYYQLNDQKNAERYYQLAIQKGAVIQQRLLAAIPAPETIAARRAVLPTVPLRHKTRPNPPSVVQTPVSSVTVRLSLPSNKLGAARS